MIEIEIEKVYLAKFLPDDLYKYTPISIMVGDFYDSNSVDALKIRRKGDKYEIIKKEKISECERKESFIEIKKGEFDILFTATVQNHRKERYLYPLDEKHICEVDVYKDKLEGYVRLEVEFKDKDDSNSFVAPEWFGPEITSINHTIHEDLGLVTFKEMEERLRKEGINLKKVGVEKR